MLRQYGLIRKFATRTHARPPTPNATRPRPSTSKPTPPPAAPAQPVRSRKSSLRAILSGIKWATAAFLTYHILTGYVLDYRPCDGISMLASFNMFGDWVLVSKYYRRGRGVQVGDVVSYKHPLVPGTVGLKRVLGMEGDFVLRDTPGIGQEEGEQKMIQVPQGHCWIVGDNLPHSRDSRAFGPLPLALIKGKCIARSTSAWNFFRLPGLSDPEFDDDVD